MAEEHEIIYDAYTMFMDYLDAVYKELSAPEQQAGGAAQDERRKAYEAVASAPPSLAEAMRAQFDAQYGSNEWIYQQTLHLARQRRYPGLAAAGPNPGQSAGTSAGGY